MKCNSQYNQFEDKRIIQVYLDNMHRKSRKVEYGRSSSPAHFIEILHDKHCKRRCDGGVCLKKRV